MQCGSVDRLEFDHVDPKTKVWELTGLLLAARAKFEAELAKCQLLCHKHHWHKTNVERGRQPECLHGTRSKYQRGCRCDLCRAAHRDAARAYARKRGVEPRSERLARIAAKHGSVKRYQKGCRCGECKAAKSAAGKREWERRRLRILVSEASSSPAKKKAPGSGEPRAESVSGAA